MPDAPSLDRRFADAMGQCLGPDFPSRIALAVSGGGDSMAMLALAHNWARVWGVSLWVVTVDHGLRPESGAEADLVAQEARLLGHRHCTLRWRWDGQGNLQARAREARLGLIARWSGALEHVLFAHTRDDVAETFLLRLARQAGVEGLAEMATTRRIEPGEQAPLAGPDCDGDLPPRGDGGTAGFTLHRPCLDMSRAELRHYARTLHVPWVEDPSNADARFDRVKMRAALPALEAVGLSRDALVSAARHMARAAEALRLRAAETFDGIGAEGISAGQPTGELLFARDGFAAADRETQLRLLSDALRYVSSQPYRPREAPLEALLDRLLAGGGGTLHGCDARMERERLRVFREFKVVEDLRRPLDGPMPGHAPGSLKALWDGRWAVGAACGGGTLRALGPDGWAQIDTVPEDAPPFAAARALPAVFRGTTLESCPALGIGAARAELRPMGGRAPDFRGFLLSH